MMGIEIIIQVIIIILAQVITKILLNCQTGKEGQNQSPLAGLALISGLFLFLKNRKRNKRK